jgi:LacI family transcriptional regulator
MATIRDVARESSVSIATVSRVFNNSPLVSEGTRERVMVAAERLGYWPNGIARSLITNRTHAIGVLLPELHGEFFSEVIHGIDLAARERGLHLLVSRATSTAAELTAALRSMRGRVDALIIMAPDREAAAVLRQHANQVPMVLLNCEANVPGADTVSVENHAGARTIVCHLLAAGHRRIATITGPLHNGDAGQRLEGYRAAMRDAGLSGEGLEFDGDFTERSGYVAARRVLDHVPRPTAVFVANDHMAIGVLGALQDAGVDVPKDIAVVGFDDIPMARYLTPPLTTVHVDIFRMGQRAMGLLLERAQESRPLEPRRELLQTTLVVRGSCGAQMPLDGETPEPWNRSRAAGSTRR